RHDDFARQRLRLLHFSAHDYLTVSPSSPTRRSPDLMMINAVMKPKMAVPSAMAQPSSRVLLILRAASGKNNSTLLLGCAMAEGRSKEDTSELQSRFDFVCRHLPDNND